MKRQRLPLLLIGLLALGVCVSLGPVVWLSPTQPGITKANFDRIKEGMTKAEVIEILGENTGQVWPAEVNGLALYALAWQGSDGSVVVVNVVDDRVVVAKWYDSDESLWDKLRRWLRLK